MTQVLTDHNKLLLASKTEELLRKSENLIQGLDELGGLLTEVEGPSSPIIQAIDLRGQDFATYYFAGYSDTGDYEKSLVIYQTVKNLVRYILLMDRYYEVGNYRYATLARSIINSIRKSSSQTNLGYSIEYSMKQFWPFWKFEQLMKQRMLTGYKFNIKEIRYHNLFKSSDAPLIYSRVLDSELPGFNRNVASILHYNQALQDIQDDYDDIKEDVADQMPNIFILSALNHMSFSDLVDYEGDVRKAVLDIGKVDTIMSMAQDYYKMSMEIAIPANFMFLKHLTREYVNNILKTLVGYS